MEHLVDDAVAAAGLAPVDQPSADRPLEEAAAAVAGEDAVVLAGAGVAAHAAHQPQPGLDGGLAEVELENLLAGGEGGEGGEGAGGAGRVERGGRARAVGDGGPGQLCKTQVGRQVNSWLESGRRMRCSAGLANQFI